MASLTYTALGSPRNPWASKGKVIEMKDYRWFSVYGAKSVGWKRRARKVGGPGVEAFLWSAREGAAIPLWQQFQATELPCG